MKQKTLFALAGSVLLSTALLTVGCTQAPPPVVDTRDADIKAIKDAEASEAKDMADKAFDRMASYYADECRLMYISGASARSRQGSDSSDVQDASGHGPGFEILQHKGGCRQERQPRLRCGHLHPDGGQSKNETAHAWRKGTTSPS